jgi:diguanylate cyclase (GGDEF)-like protein
MQKLLNTLAHLSGLRDREKMNFALVRLISNTELWPVSATRLVRAVGQPGSQHWFTLARLEHGATEPTGDRSWVDDAALPRLAEFPHREAAMVTEALVRTGSGPFISIFPIDTHSSVCSLLELVSEEPLSASVQAQIESVVWIYQNLQGLLDYGEKDALTELLNRKTFDSAFHRAAVEQQGVTDLGQPDRRVKHTGGHFWLAVLDIDHFKRVNDNFGHLIGDEVLLLMARQMRTSFRSHDQLYRFGGEEFVVLMRCDSVDHAHAALERLRERVQAYTFPQVGTITVSIGFSVLLPHDTPSGAFGRADKAVYHAKEHGRNQVCSYQALVASGDLVDVVAEGMDVDLF